MERGLKSKDGGWKRVEQLTPLMLHCPPSTALTASRFVLLRMNKLRFTSSKLSLPTPHSVILSGLSFAEVNEVEGGMETGGDQRINICPILVTGGYPQAISREGLVFDPLNPTCGFCCLIFQCGYRFSSDKLFAPYKEDAIYCHENSETNSENSW